MNKAYVYLTIGHKSFVTGKTAIVAMDEDFAFIESYKDAATRKVCDHLGLPVNEIIIFDWKFLGENVLVMK